MKQTKEQLLAVIAQLEYKVKTLEASADNIRLEMSKALDSPVANEGRYDQKQTVYTWQQIFCEIGKLLAANELRRLRENLDTVYREKQDLAYQLEMAGRDSHEPK